LINNRQSGRRRGRGGGPRSPNNAPNPGNRQDNRSRGNAAQLHEKYKALARDMQLAGDRVQTEYYLQFADHYFRVLNENRARFEEQRPRRDDYMSDEDEDQDENLAADGDEERNERPQRDDRPQREYREPRPERAERVERAERPEGDRFERNGAEQGQSRRRPRRDRTDEPREEQAEERISLDVLPPAIAADGGEVAKAPRRRARRPRPEGDAEIAPAA
jgi:hypothetical protein